MKRCVAVILSALLMLSLLGGCGNSKTEESTTKEQASSETASDASEEGTAASDTEADEELKLDKKVEIKTPSKVDQTGAPEEGETVAVIHVKNYGDISVKFFYEDSPLAVENFLTLAANGYYDGVIFHRVIADFMIQGGDPTGTGMGGTSMWGKEFANEYSDRLAQINGSLAMARTQELDTNGSQFFINNGKQPTDEQLADLDISDEMKELFKEKGGNPWLQGQYTVFGQVYEGMDVVDAISATATDTNDKPVEDIVIESIEVTEYSK